MDIGGFRKAREDEQMRCKEVTNKLVAEMERMRQHHALEVQQAAAAAKAKVNETIMTMEAARAAAVQEAVSATRKEVESECNRCNSP